MKTILLLMILSTPGLCHSQNKFWFSNKVEVGYGKAFISDQVSFKEGVFVKNTFGLGLKVKVSKKVSYQTHYLLENAEKNNWRLAHVIGARFNFKF
ncbi:hypothetical protein OAA64_01040 [bacterium]|nr:hypothetical protein [bacterium]